MTPVTQPTDTPTGTGTPTSGTPTSAPAGASAGASAGGGVQPGPLPDAKAPVGPGLITAMGVVLATTLIALGVVALHDALIPTGLVNGPAWINSALGALDGLAPPPWLVPAALLGLLIGLWALITALRPRPSTAIALTARTGVYLRPKDVARIARTATHRLDAVTTTTTRATRRTVNVSVRATTPTDVAQHVHTAVTHALDALATTPKIRVRVTPERGTR